MPDVHARLSASGAKRWMSCPPSVRLEESIPDKGSPYAEEGTFAHSLAELYLRYNNGELTKRSLTAKLNTMKKNSWYNEEMNGYIQNYVGLVWEQLNEARAHCKDAFALFEQRLDFSRYVPDAFGTGDVVIIADDTLQVIDLKYGKGVPISAVENPQLRLYGIGAYLEHSLLYDIQRVKMTIIQPRLDSISTEEMPIGELLQWAETEVAPKAALAIEGKGEFKVGDHCKFCKAFATCRAQKDHQLELAKYSFVEGDLLDDDEIGDVLARVDDLVKWAEAIKEYAFDMALNEHVKFDGWKLVEGRSNRKYSDPEKIGEILQTKGYSEEIIYKPKELKGITDMTKILGKKTFEELLNDYIVKPPGKPVLVPESDKRPELNTMDKIKEEFEQ